MPAYLCQVHHANQSWRADGRTEWVLPPHLDTGQPRINNYHHPEDIITPATMRVTTEKPGVMAFAMDHELSPTQLS
jgi:hypothetical protein